MMLTSVSVALDFTPHGTQPGLLWALEEPDSCMSCHRGYSGTAPNFMPHNTWGGSMMANAARDPLFWAALDVANKDFPGAGDYCLRCHTPPGWSNGRVVKAIGGGSSGPGGASGCQLTGNYNAYEGKSNDYAGITCHFCHRMMPSGPAPEYAPAMIGNANIWIDNATECMNPDGSTYGGPCRRGPYSYSNGMLEPPHGWAKSAYHESSALCGTCHDVTTPDTDEGPLKTLVLEGGVATTRPVPIERTYSEWDRSLFSDLIFRDGLGEGVTSIPALARSQQCQDCHMRSSEDPEARACNNNPLGSRAGDLPVHEFAGANTWVPKIIQAEYAATGFGREADYDLAILNAQNMLASSAKVETSILSYTPPTKTVAGAISVRVKVTNLSGHKLPTGYGEGRRMWLNVKAVSSSDALIAESAAYDATTAVLTLDSQAKVYETMQGIWTPGTPGECRIEEGGKKMFHFVLNNCIRKDNRIPPLGFRPKTAEDPNGDETRPVGYSYAETSPGSGTLVNYDITDYNFVLPAGTARPIRIDARLNFQISSKDYIEFLRDQANEAPAIPAENLLCADGPGRPFDIGPQSLSRGQYMFELWSNPAYGKSPPETAGIPSSVITPN